MALLNKKDYNKWLEYLDIKINDLKNISKSQNGNLLKKETIYNNFNYNYILNNKKGFLFKEGNDLYTYNLYEQKIKAEVLDGSTCNYCSYTRYNYSPCVYRDCKNRKYDDFEFKMYKKINGKEMQSKYNINYNTNIIEESIPKKDISVKKLKMI
jgi:hypothetical protein